MEGALARDCSEYDDTAGSASRFDRNAAIFLFTVSISARSDEHFFSSSMRVLNSNLQTTARYVVNCDEAHLKAVDSLAESVMNMAKPCLRVLSIAS